MNCAFYDTSVKFGTNVEHINTKIFGYRAISNFARKGIGGHFVAIASPGSTCVWRSSIIMKTAIFRAVQPVCGKRIHVL